MGDLDLTEFWGHDDLQKLAREADFDAEKRTKRSAGYEFFESSDEDENYDDDEEEDEPPVKRRCYPVMYEHERAD